MDKTRRPQGLSLYGFPRVYKKDRRLTNRAILIHFLYVFT